MPADPADRTDATLLAHAGSFPETGHVVMPIPMGTTFSRDANYELPLGVDYTRDGAPIYRPIEALITALERGRDALLFASGMAAASAIVETLERGDHLIMPSSMYWGLRKHVAGRAARLGIEVTFAPLWEDGAFAAALRPTTRMVWIESPANPTLGVTDLARVLAEARAADVESVVDNTVPTPILTKPLTLGADWVMHSATKYLNGHSDVLAGVLVAGEATSTGRRAERWEALRTYRHDTGPMLGPFEAWLLLRGMRTLRVRVLEESRTALAVAEFLSRHPGVEEVLYPGLRAHPNHAVAARQMQGGFGGLLSFLVAGGRAEALAAAGRLELIVRATSLGGTESLIEHRASIEGDHVAPNLLRLSVGLEDVDDLLADLSKALGR